MAPGRGMGLQVRFPGRPAPAFPALSFLLSLWLGKGGGGGKVGGGGRGREGREVWCGGEGVQSGRDFPGHPGFWPVPQFPTRFTGAPRTVRASLSPRPKLNPRSSEKPWGHLHAHPEADTPPRS